MTSENRLNTGFDGIKSKNTTLGWLVRSSGVVVAARIAGVLLSIIIQVLIARALGAAELGLFFVASAISMVLATFLAAGYPLMVPKFVARSVSPQGAAGLKDFMSFARGSTVRFSIGICSLGVLIIWFWPALGLTERFIFTIALFSAPPLAFLRLNGALANAMRRFSLGYLPDILARPLLLLGLIGMLWIFYPGFDLLMVLSGYIVIAFALAAWQMSRVSLPQSGGAVRKTRPNKDLEPGFVETKTEMAPAPGQKRQWFMQSLNIMPGTIFVMVFGDITLLIAGMFLKSADIGIFGVTMRMSLLAAFAIHTVQQISVRDIADAVNQGASKKLAQSLKRVNLLNTALAIGGIGFAIIFGQLVLGIFGPEFTTGYASLVILMAAQLVRAATGPTLQMIALTGLERASLPAFAAGFLVLAVSSALLMPMLALAGAALAVLLATSTWSVWLSVVLWRRTGINVALARP